MVTVLSIEWHKERLSDRKSVHLTKNLENILRYNSVARPSMVNAFASEANFRIEFRCTQIEVEKTSQRTMEFINVAHKGKLHTHFCGVIES